MTIKEEIQIEEYKRTFAEAYKQGFIDAMSMRTKYDKGLQLFANILFDKEKSKQFLKECKAIGIELQMERDSE